MIVNLVLILLSVLVRYLTNKDPLYDSKRDYHNYKPTNSFYGNYKCKYCNTQFKIN